VSWKTAINSSERAFPGDSSAFALLDGAGSGTRVYDPDTNTFGAFNADGTTRTLFKPNPDLHGYETNLEYWDAQIGVDPWTP
jgi:hypothetical protein